MVSTVSSKQGGPVFDTRLEEDLSVWSLHVLSVFAWISPGFSGFLPQFKDMQVKL